MTKSPILVGRHLSNDIKDDWDYRDYRLFNSCETAEKYADFLAMRSRPRDEVHASFPSGQNYFVIYGNPAKNKELYK